MTRIVDKPVWVMAKGYAPDEGGHQTYAREVAHTYRDWGAQVTVYTQTTLGPRVTEMDGVRVIDIGYPGGVKTLTRWMGAMHRTHDEEGRPAVIHGTTWRTSVPPMLLGLPYYTSFFGREFMYPRGATLTMMRRVATSATRIATISHYSAARLAKRLPRVSDIPVAWLGYSADRWQDRDFAVTDAPPRLLSLCRLEPRKNIVGALRAVAAAKAAGLRFHYDICGRGDDHAALSDLITTQGLGDCVTLHGFVDDATAQDLYRRADVFLHPQLAIDDDRDFEGFGIAIADAMAAGTAVLVGQDGAPAELIRDGVTGRVVDGRDATAMADAVALLIRDAAERTNLAKAGQAFARNHFTWKGHVATLLGRTVEQMDLGLPADVAMDRRDPLRRIGGSRTDRQ